MPLSAPEKPRADVAAARRHLSQLPCTHHMNMDCGHEAKGPGIISTLFSFHSVFTVVLLNLLLSHMCISP